MAYYFYGTNASQSIYGTSSHDVIRGHHAHRGDPSWGDDHAARSSKRSSSAFANAHPPKFLMGSNRSRSSDSLPVPQLIITMDGDGQHDGGRKVERAARGERNLK